MTRQEMLDLVEAVLEASPVPDAVVILTEAMEGAVRFGQNRITQNLDTFERKLRLVLGRDGRQAAYTTHRVGMSTISDTIAAAMELLETAQPDPEYMPPVEGGQVYPLVEDWDAETAEADPGARIGAAAEAIRNALEYGMEASGLAGASSEVEALGTSTGNLAFHSSTRASFSLTMDRNGGSSYRSQSSSAWMELPVTDIVHRVADEAELAQDPADLKPGLYRMVLEPQAVADLIPFLAWSLSARQSDEGLTVFTGRDGRQVTGERFTMRSEVTGELRGVPFSEEGAASEDTAWIERGVLENQPCDRYWASKTGRKPLFIPGTLLIDGGSGSLEDLVEGISGQALLFRRFWYIRFVDQKELSLTGMTRDGVFLVQDGRIVRPVKDFRWNWKPLDIFSRIEILGTPERKGRLMVPPMVIGVTPL
jgi:predicted Zn-dependent protease